MRLQVAFLLFAYFIKPKFLSVVSQPEGGGAILANLVKKYII